MHKEIVKALNDIAPNAEWLLTGDSYDDLEWLDKTIKKPSKSEIDNAIANPKPEKEPTIEEKLAIVGLSLNDLKSALGI